MSQLRFENHAKSSAHSEVRATADVRPNFGVTCSGNFFGLDLLRRVEDLGYDAFYTGDHFVYDKPIQDAIPVLGAAAAATSRISIGAAVFLAPLYPPVLLAKATSTLDVLSGGRLVVGIGVGGEFPKEFESFGIPLATRGRRTDEILDIVKALWTGEPVTYDGEFYQLEATTLQPPCVQRGGPPIWVSGRAAASMRRAARCGDGYLPYLVSPDSYRRRAEVVRAEAATLGRELPSDFGWALRIEMCLDDSPIRARQRSADLLSWRFGRPFSSDEAARYCLAGTSDEVLERARSYMDAGVEVFALQPVGNDAAEMNLSLTRFAEEVMPELRSMTSS